jgi:hypothetical protein
MCFAIFFQAFQYDDTVTVSYNGFKENAKHSPLGSSPSRVGLGEVA